MPGETSRRRLGTFPSCLCDVWRLSSPNWLSCLLITTNRAPVASFFESHSRTRMSDQMEAERRLPSEEVIIFSDRIRHMGLSGPRFISLLTARTLNSFLFWTGSHRSRIGLVLAGPRMRWQHETLLFYSRRKFSQRWVKDEFYEHA